MRAQTGQRISNQKSFSFDFSHEKNFDRALACSFACYLAMHYSYISVVLIFSVRLSLYAAQPVRVIFLCFRRQWCFLCPRAKYQLVHISCANLSVLCRYTRTLHALSSLSLALSVFSISSATERTSLDSLIYFAVHIQIFLIFFWLVRWLDVGYLQYVRISVSLTVSLFIAVPGVWDREIKLVYVFARLPFILHIKSFSLIEYIRLLLFQRNKRTGTFYWKFHFQANAYSSCPCPSLSLSLH